MTTMQIPKNLGLTGLFEVYSIAGGKALCEPMEFDAVSAKFDSIALGSGGACNGMDIRRVTS